MASTWTEKEKGYMREALVMAKRALDTLEVAVGCVFVSMETGEIVARGHNDTNARCDTTRHAELVAYDSIAERLAPTAPPSGHSGKPGAGDKSLLCVGRDNLPLRGLELYVTVEPCIMCAAFLSEHGVSRVTYGCANPRFGGTGTVLPVSSIETDLFHAFPSRGGLLADEAIELLQRFYAQNNPRTQGLDGKGTDDQDRIVAAGKE